MKLKKYIKLMEDEPQEEMTEHELELYNSLLERVEKNATARTAKRVKLWSIFAPIVSSLLVAAITLTCVFSLRKISDEFLYKDDNIVTQESEYELMKTDVVFFDLYFNEFTISQVDMSYDLKSKDKLLYRVNANFEDSRLDIKIVINEKYNYQFNLNGEEKRVELAQYTLNYSSLILRGKPQIEYRGWIKVQTEIVYFEFFQKPALGDEAFFETIQQVVKVKK